MLQVILIQGSPHGFGPWLIGGSQPFLQSHSNNLSGPLLQYISLVPSSIEVS